VLLRAVILPGVDFFPEIVANSSLFTKKQLKTFGTLDYFPYLCTTITKVIQPALRREHHGF
jgi:hypothetical protein